MSSSKTLSPFVLADWTRFSGASLRSGMMRSGTVFPLPPLARPTDAIGSGSWATPQAEDGESTGMSAARLAAGRTPDNLPSQVRLWPTPTKTEAGGSAEGFLARKARHNDNPTLSALNLLVQEVAKLRPTPAARDYRAPNAPDGPSRLLRPPTSGEQLPNAIGGVLNPEWVELLMGYPPGYTDTR